MTRQKWKKFLENFLTKLILKTFKHLSTWGKWTPNGRSEMQEALMSYENDKYINNIYYIYNIIYISSLSKIYVLYDKYSIW